MKAALWCGRFFRSLLILAMIGHSADCLSQSEFVAISYATDKTPHIIPAIAWVSQTSNNVDPDLVRSTHFNNTSGLYEPSGASQTIHLEAHETKQSPASSAVVVRGLVASARAYISTDRTSVYVVYDVISDEYYKDPFSSSGSKRPLLLSLAITGGVVTFGNGSVEVVKSRGLGFPQLGHTYLFAAQSISGSPSFDIDNVYYSHDGQVVPLLGDSNSSSAQDDLRAIKNMFPETIPGLIASEDTLVPVLSLNHASTEEPASSLKHFRHRSDALITNQKAAISVPFMSIVGKNGAIPTHDVDAIVVATVLSNKLHVASDLKAVYSTNQIRIDRILPSNNTSSLSPSSLLEIEVYGGRVIDKSGHLRIVGIRGQLPLNPANQYILFLKRSSTDNTWRSIYSYRLANGYVYTTDRYSSASRNFDGMPLDAMTTTVADVINGTRDANGVKRDH